MMFLKTVTEITNLSIDELILLYFNTSEESRNPHVKFDGANPIKMKKDYMGKNRKQLQEILKILRNKDISTNYFNLRYKQFKIKSFS